MQKQQQPQKFEFVYKGVEYDATDYAQKHPGGLSFLKNMKAVHPLSSRALHSDTAEKVLKSLPVISQGKPSKQSQEYLQIYKKMQNFHSPIWTIQILLCLLVASTWLIACTTQYTILSIICFTFTQILIGWVGHSAAHSRDRGLNIFGRIQTALIGGFSLQWWSPKHNMHHMFTNIVKYDEDIQHSYKVYLFQFLYLKWRFDSLVSAIKSMNWIDVSLIIINYICLGYFRHNLLNWVIGSLIAGFYSAFVLIGNHERQVRYPENPNKGFIDHQIQTCRNYKQTNIFWLILMGGMQYQTQHHLFPQIPFYRIPQAKAILHSQLDRLNKTLIYGPVI